jgi:hypothetical protein
MKMWFPDTIFKYPCSIWMRTQQLFAPPMTKILGPEIHDQAEAAANQEFSSESRYNF